LIEVTNIRVRSFDLDRLDLWWEISTTSEDPQDYDLYVLRSTSPLGPYEPLHDRPLSDVYHFRDARMGLMHNWRQLYYRIRMVNRATGETRDFPEDRGASVDPPLALDALEAARYEEILFKEKIGRPCWLFKKRTFGPRCPHCFDERLQRAKTKRCPACYGASYLHGFMSPIQFYCQIDPTTQSNQQSTKSEQREERTMARCIFFPPVTPEDVIVELENVRWRVAKVTPTKRLGSVIHQELTLRRIPEGSIEYTLPLDVDLENFVGGPDREFTNPQNLENADRPHMDIRDLAAAYRWVTR